MKFIYTDEEILAMMSRQPLPMTPKRFIRLMNGRIKSNAAYRRLNQMVDRGLLLSKKFRYSYTSGTIKVYGTGSQMEKFDDIWKEEKGREGIARYEEDWYSG